jgi:S1-C subfamily serine protease
MSNGPPAGRIRAKPRPFEKVVADVRHAVYAVTRHRRAAQGGFQGWALGSGFFVSSRVFVTCAHVIMHPANPHQDGDQYQLVNNLGTGATIHSVREAVVGNNVHVFADDDLAILLPDGNQEQAYLPLEYGDVNVGADIGVAGYPLPELIVVGGALRYDGLVFRVARNVVTSTYRTNIPMDIGISLTDIPVIEVNFLFVPGNSGGPIFAADTGRVLAFVHGYRTQKIQERVETVTLIPTLPQGVASTYISNQSALYSLGIKLNRVRSHLERFGVSL